MSRRQAIALAAAGIGSCARRAECLDPLRLTVGGGHIEVSFAPGDFDAGRDAIRNWIWSAATAAAVYFGRFPVPRAVVEVRPVEGRSGIFGGVTYGETPARTKIAVGRQTSVSELDDDWTMTHELTHMGFPCVPRQHHWMEEGLATYVEPVARAQAGTLGVERVWGDMVRDMPKGEPRPGDRGLDHTRTWANTYWGGALFCLMADVEFRERTDNRRGLQHALRGILKAGGNIEVDWPLERAFEAGDEAAGVPVLAELYARAKDTPVSTNLAELWRRLGVEAAGEGVAFRDDAGLAAVRRAITMRPK